MISMRLARLAFVALLNGLIVSACSEAPVRATASPNKTNPSQSPLAVETIGRLLVQARDAAVEGDFAEAHKLIAKAEAVVDKTPLEQYKIAEIRANIAMREKDPLAAESAYEEIVNSPAAEPETYSDYLKKLTLLTFNNRHYEKTVLYGNQWLAKYSQLDSTVAEAVANSYYIKRDFGNAESMIDRILSAYEKRRGEVKLNWLQMKLSCAAVLRGKDSDAALRNQLVEAYPQFRKQLVRP